jgi:hypothetical protein
MDVKAILRIAYRNQKYLKMQPKILPGVDFIKKFMPYA